MRVSALVYLILGVSAFATFLVAIQAVAAIYSEAFKDRVMQPHTLVAIGIGVVLLTLSALTRCFPDNTKELCKCMTHMRTIASFVVASIVLIIISFGVSILPPESKDILEIANTTTNGSSTRRTPPSPR